MKNFKQYNEFHNIYPEYAPRDSLYNPPFDEDEFKYPVGRKNECETCGGHGFVWKRYQHPRLEYPAETRCPDCRGTGRKEEE